LRIFEERTGRVSCRPKSIAAHGVVAMVTLKGAMLASPSRTRLRVLVVDDDAEMRDALSLFFAAEGHDCELAGDAVTALGLVRRLELDAVICDVKMEGMTGLDLLDRVKRTHPTLPFVVITGRGSGIPEAVDAMKRGAFQYVTKPCNLDDLRTIVTDAIGERRRLIEPNRRPISSFPPLSPPAIAQSRPPPVLPSFELVGSGRAMRALHTNIDFVAASSAPVVVSGETGVGKELVARAIHARGPRSRKPFLAVNTSAIPPDLLESEIFGHVRGGFTGAVESRKGLLAEADGGTVLLDEIGDMPVGLQAKLLRVLQFGDVRPVGGDRVREVDVRVIAATHRDLAALVRDGLFREDLYFRLNVLQLFVPPLRQRREDIPELAAHILAQARLRAPHSPVRSIEADVLRALTEAPWPGNVRELANVIERGVVFGTSESVTLADGPPTCAAPDAAAPWPGSQTPSTLRSMSRAYTQWVLLQTGGNKERAAEILGIDLSTLYRWQRARKD
jgi:two-component system response regulator HydG